jgi:hypothetical protein
VPVADEKEKTTIEEMVLTKVIQLNAVVQGVVTGIVVGLIIFVATNWLVIKGGPIGPHGDPVVGPHLSLLNQFFIGYRVTFFGSLVGLAYGFAAGFGVGYVVARVYNWIVDLRGKTPPSHA